ncbi:MAG: HEAT repeat domain-containing protein [Gemmatimonadaceae bacterium]|nr:HEAT repeat domain-containing protein [Gemmatimonadaceae bacterium]
MNTVMNFAMKIPIRIAMNIPICLQANVMSCARRSIGYVTAAALMACVAPTVVKAQTSVGALEDRIASVRDGVVRLEYPAKAGVCGDGQNWFRTRDGSSYGRGNGVKYVESVCEPGPVRVVIERKEGITQDVRTFVGGKWATLAGAADPLIVSAEVATGALLNIVERETTKAAQHAVIALTIADGVQPWERLLKVVKNESRPREVRQQAVFWLGDAAGDKVTQTLESIAYDPGDREVREQAIFAMSRRPDEEAVTSLLRMAETLPDRQLRKTAIFWLSRSKDPRALAWLERALSGKP